MYIIYMSQSLTVYLTKVFVYLFDWKKKSKVQNERGAQRIITGCR